ncbi:unnamed protein product [Amoebophrya sp. A25]|nr:unnamed protein product [Amoebophrya sp. A25]|eukprot:GSA25T00000743001.1
MLDLMTLGLSLGAQEELNKAREAHGAELNQETAAPAEQTPTVVSQAAEVVESALAAVESAASSVVDAMLPGGDMVETVMQSCAVEAPTIDLSLPSSSSSVPVAKK